MMVHQTLAMLVAGGIITVLHAMGPDHWLPHIVLSKAQGWTIAKTLRITLVASVGHVGLTIVLGLAIIYLVVEIELGSQALTNTIMALVLLALGLLFVARGFRPAPSHVKAMSDQAATLVILMVAIFPPCYAILPLFLAASSHGWSLALPLVLLFSLLTIGVMLTLVALGRKGYAALDRRGILHRLEERQNTIIGVVFLFLAAIVWLGL